MSAPRRALDASARAAGAAGLVAGRVVAVVFVGFLLFRLLPGDPLSLLTRGGRVSAEELARRRQELGLDRPVLAQFGDYLTRSATGDLGVSVAYRRPVTQLIGERVGPTLLLLGTSSLLACLVGTLTGSWAGWRPGGRFDRSWTTAALVAWAMPAFWLGLVLLVTLGSGAGPVPAVFPAGGMRSSPPPAGLPATVADVARHLFLPCLTLTVVQVAQYHLVMRAGVAAQLGRPHLLVATATGLRAAQVRRRHAVPHALAPVLALTAVNLGFAVSGSVTVEAVFSWPGLGQLALQAAQLPDLPLLNGIFLAVAVSVVATSALADAAVRRWDPRPRSWGRSAW